MILRFLVFTAALVLVSAGPAAAGPVVGFLATSIGSLGVAGATATAIATGITRLVIGLALSAIAQALQPKPKTPGISTEFTQTGGDNPQGVIVGWYATAGTFLAPPMSHGTVGDTPNSYLTYVIALSDMPITSVSKVWIGETEVPFDGAVHADYGTAATGDYAGYAWLKVYDGTQTAADPMLLDKYGSDPERPWSADMVGTDLAYAILTFRYNRSLYNGLPQVRFELTGIPLYDPRRDDTAGGTGAHRWDDPSTWETSNNPIVQAYNILRGITLPDGSVYGGGVEASALPFDVWVAAMNACDADAETDSGTEPAYRAGFEIKVDEEPFDVLDELMKAASASYVEAGGKWYVRVGPAGLPVYFFSDDDVLRSSDQEMDPFPGLAETYNAVHATHPDPAQLWEVTDAPPRYDAALEAEDAGRRLPADVQLPAVPYPDQVQRLTKAWLEDARRFRQHRISLPPEALTLNPLDAVSWTSARNGYSDKVMEVSGQQVDWRSLTVGVGLRERDPGDYDWQASDLLPSDTPSTVVVQPSTTVVPGWSVAAVTITDGSGTDRRPAIRLSWTAPLDAVDGIQWEVRRAGTSEVILTGSTENFELGQVTLSESILPATSYEARGRLVTDLPTGWTAWTAVTTADVGLTADDLADAVKQDIADAQATADQAVADASTAQDAANAAQQDHDQLVGTFTGTIEDLVNDIAANGGAIDTLSYELFAQMGVLGAKGVFEDGTVGDWSSPNVGPTAVTESNNPPGRSHVMRHTDRGATYGDPIVGDLNGKTYRVSGYVRTFNSTVPARAGIRYKRASDGTEVFQTTEVAAAGAAWASFSVDIAIPEATSEYRAYLLNAGTYGSDTMQSEWTDLQWADVTQETTVFASLTQDYYTAADTDTAIAAADTALKSAIEDPNGSSLGATVDSILGTEANALTGTAFATLLDQLQVDAGGTSATITQQSSAIADLEGNASAQVVFEAQAGSEVSLLQLVAADGSGTSYSIAKISAEQILLDGSVSAPLLTIMDGSGNLVANGDFGYGDLRGWNVTTGSASVVDQTSNASTSVQAGPSRYMADLGAATDVTVWTDEAVTVEAGDLLTVSYSASTGGTGIADIGVQLVFYDEDGAQVGGDFTLYEEQYSATGWQKRTRDVTAPAGTKTMKARMRRAPQSTGTEAGAAFITLVDVRKKQTASTVIAPGSITTDLLSTVDFGASGIAIFGGTLQSDSYVQDTAGWKFTQNSFELNGTFIRTGNVQDEAITSFGHNKHDTSKDLADDGTAKGMVYGKLRGAADKPIQVAWNVRVQAVDTGGVPVFFEVWLERSLDDGATYDETGYVRRQYYIDSSGADAPSEVLLNEMFLDSPTGVTGNITYRLRMSLPAENYYITTGMVVTGLDREMQLLQFKK